MGSLWVVWLPLTVQTLVFDTWLDHKFTALWWVHYSFLPPLKDKWYKIDWWIYLFIPNIRANWRCIFIKHIFITEVKWNYCKYPLLNCTKQCSAETRINKTLGLQEQSALYNLSCTFYRDSSIPLYHCWPCGRQMSVDCTVNCITYQSSALTVTMSSRSWKYFTRGIVFCLKLVKRRSMAFGLSSGRPCCSARLCSLSFKRWFVQARNTTKSGVQI